MQDNYDIKNYVKINYRHNENTRHYNVNVNNMAGDVVAKRHVTVAGNVHDDEIEISRAGFDHFIELLASKSFHPYEADYNKMDYNADEYHIFTVQHSTSGMEDKLVYAIPNDFADEPEMQELISAFKTGNNYLR